MMASPSSFCFLFPPFRGLQLRMCLRAVAPHRPPTIEVCREVPSGAFAAPCRRARLRDLVYSGWPIFALLRELRLKLSRPGPGASSWRQELDEGSVTEASLCPAFAQPSEIQLKKKQARPGLDENGSAADFEIGALKEGLLSGAFAGALSQAADHAGHGH